MPTVTVWLILLSGTAGSSTPSSVPNVKFADESACRAAASEIWFRTKSNDNTKTQHATCFPAKIIKE